MTNSHFEKIELHSAKPKFESSRFAVYKLIPFCFLWWVKAFGGTTKHTSQIFHFKSVDTSPRVSQD